MQKECDPRLPTAGHNERNATRGFNCNGGNERRVQEERLRRNAAAREDQSVIISVITQKGKKKTKHQPCQTMEHTFKIRRIPDH